MLPKLPEITPGLSVQAMKQAYHEWSKNISTSPFGRHLGHYPAILKSDGLKADSDKSLAMASSRDEIWKIHHQMFDYGIQNANCFTWWKQIVNAMIEKEPGNTSINQLCVIHLYKNDYNLLIGSQYRLAGIGVRPDAP
jgi:hypothetical protein